ncbi:hypothetical protein MKEN_00834500 [Mycena kentingensis (nom. inval.)]|nr:hypothetical protein MKEN_00834500 [Mycena kentingensis (nom. inval.)]
MKLPRGKGILGSYPSPYPSSVYIPAAAGEDPEDRVHLVPPSRQTAGAKDWREEESDAAAAVLGAGTVPVRAPAAGGPSSRNSAVELEYATTPTPMLGMKRVLGKRKVLASSVSWHLVIQDEDENEDPAFRFAQDIVSKLRTYARDWCERQLDPAAADRRTQPYTELELLAVQFDRERVWTHNTAQINYTTYDLQRDQDTVNIRTRPNIMVLSSDTTNRHPYEYAEVILIGHARVKIPGMASYKHMEFLYIRNYERVRSQRCIPEANRMPKLRYIDYLDPDAFGFLDPNAVIRGVHVIPAFAFGRTDEFLPPSVIRPETEEDTDWNFYYVNGYVSPPPLRSD